MVTSMLVVSIGIPTAAILLIFSLRRVTFTLAVLGQREVNDRPSNSTDPRDVLVLVSCRDEEATIPGLIEAVRRMEYPAERFQVVLVDDGSTDSTGRVMYEHAAVQPGWHVVNLRASLGKAAALNAALARIPFGEYLYVLDADHRPDPRVLVRMQPYFDNPHVAGVQGFTKVTNPAASPSAFYSTVESYINQLVTMRAKDRLRLAPALLGSNCVYRRSALVACGGFREGAFSEDSDLTVTFHLAGYVTRFAEDVVSHQEVPQTVRGYLRQHVRWGRGLNDVARAHATDLLRSSRLRWLLRLELLLFIFGYLDRLALLAAGVLVVTGAVGSSAYLWLALVAPVLLIPLAQVLVLFVRERMEAAMWLRLPWIPVFFALDVTAAVRSMMLTVLNAPREWAKTERAAEPTG